MSAPAIINVEQVPEGQFQQMFVPQMVPFSFVAAPEFCEGMWVPPLGSPLGGFQADWHQGGYRGPLQKRQFRQSHNYGSPAMAPQMPPAMLPPAMLPVDLGWPQQDFPEEPAGVELSSLPKMLCNRKCLEAAIEQAGLEGDVQSLELKSGNTGKAVLILTNDRAAQRCIKHFHGLQWAKSSQPVAARYFPQAGEKPDAQQQQSQQLHTPKLETKSKPPAVPKPVENVTAKKAADLVKPKMSPPMSPATTITLSPKSSISSSPGLRPRWADLESDDEDDDDHSKSTRAGTWGSSPPGSSDSDN